MSEIAEQNYQPIMPADVRRHMLSFAKPMLTDRFFVKKSEYIKENDVKKIA